ncbi:MAG: hypothetical protein ACE5IY_22345 [bacterium]
MRRITVVLILFAVGLLAARVQAGEGAAAKFNQMKLLSGSWRGENHEGKTVSVIYEVVSNGSALMERMKSGDEPDMITMYHLDGDQLMMTHYCSAMNQPRMRAEIDDNANVVNFALFDITNLEQESDGHMVRMVMSIKDSDHLTHEWTFLEEGKKMAAPFELERVKMSQK